MLTFKLDVTMWVKRASVDYKSNNELIQLRFDIFLYVFLENHKAVLRFRRRLRYPSLSGY
jgi:hypothetical protein